MQRPIPYQGSPRLAGMSLVELLVAFTILLIGLSGLVKVLLGNFALNEQARGVALAMHSSRSLVEQMRSRDVDDVFVFYNDFAGDDPPGGAAGPDFAVPGLDPDPNDPDGVVGEVLFPVQVGAPGVVSELANPNFPGFPRDLNLDGDAIDADVNADAVMLPVIVRLRWVGPSGAAQTYDLPTLLSGL